jgi:autotransporter-associated beta strand protein
VAPSRLKAQAAAGASAATERAGGRVCRQAGFARSSFTRLFQAVFETTLQVVAVEIAADEDELRLPALARVAAAIDGAGGSIVKDGNRMLTLTNANTYTGGTIIDAGTLAVRNLTGSATGTGSVQVNHGTLAGTGTISGPVTVASSAFLAPGVDKKIGALSLLGGVTFNSHSTCLVELKSTTATADKVAAFGVTVQSGAHISIGDLGTTSLPSGTILTVISNTGATPIAGTFSNLPDNSTVTVGSNTYQVSYEGGDGNDLTLTVVP